ncbi:hypothetical protein LINPERPRIM_LOCUS731 [Linum perenne]
MASYAPFDAFFTQLAHAHVLHTNDHFRSSTHRALYNQFYFDRPTIPIVRLDPVAFSKYGFNTTSLIANLGWSSLLMRCSSKYYPDAVYQFYVNLQVEGSLNNGKFSTYVDGHIIYVTPALLASVLDLPHLGASVFQEDDFHLLNFKPSSALSTWTGETYSSYAVTTSSKLPEHLRLLHYFITHVFLPRSLGQYLVTPLDTWLLHCVVSNIPVDYSTLMFSIMTKFGNHLYEGELPFGSMISSFLERLGITLRMHFSEAFVVDNLRPQHVLRQINWSGCKPVNASGGYMDADDILEEAERNMTIWSTLEGASDYDSTPEHLAGF